MKKLYVFFLLAFAATSCQNFEEEPVTTEDSAIETRATGADGQDYYWYNGEKMYLIRSEKYVNIATNGKLVKSSKAEVVANSLTRNEQVKILPFFERGEGTEPIGTSDIFYLKLRNKEDISLLRELANKLGVRVIEEIPYTPLWYTLSILESEFGSSVEASNYFYETGKFENVDPAFMFDFKPSADDVDFWRQWGMNNTSNPSIDIDVIPAWNIARGAGVKVAVVDTPIESGHSDLNDNIHSLSYNAKLKRTPSAAYVGGSSHGTHVAGIIAAEKNGSQVTGVAYESKIMRVSHDIIFTSTISSELAAGINWAWQNGADVINCSWGDRDQYHNVHMELHSAVLEQAIVSAMTQGRGNKGCVVVFAAGNSGHLGAVINYPGNFHNDILVVGSVDQTGNRSSFSGYGAKLDVVAPGGSIWSTIPYSSIGSMDGTSMAAPHVSGIAALILSVYPDLRGSDVGNIIMKSASYYPHRSNATGYGLVNAYKAFTEYMTPKGPNPVMAYAMQPAIYRAPAPSGGVVFNGWEVTPSYYTCSTYLYGDHTLSITFTSPGTFAVTAKYILPGGIPLNLTMRNISVVSATAQAPQIITPEGTDWYPYSGEMTFDVFPRLSGGVRYEWDCNEMYWLFNPDPTVGAPRIVNPTSGSYYDGHRLTARVRAVVGYSPNFTYSPWSNWATITLHN